MKIFVINGHEKYPYNKGLLNQTLFEKIINELSTLNEVVFTVLQDGYDVRLEQEKFLSADIVIFQTPVYWFSVPALLKKYIELVYGYGVFYRGSSDYGRGGLFSQKRYMFSLTMNAPEYAFNNIDEFFDGHSIDDLILPLHKLHEFCSMKPIPTFSCYDVVKNPDIQKYLDRLKEHLDKYIHPLI